MDENLENQEQSQDALVEGNMDDSSPEEMSSAGDSESKGKAKDDPYSIKKRLGIQAKRHEKEMRAIKDELYLLRSQHAPSGNEYSQPLNPYTQQPIAPGSGEEQIHKAVLYALGMKEQQQKKAEESQKLAYVHDQLANFDRKLSDANDKYDDFDEVVRGDNVPFSTAMRDAAAHLLPFDNANDVLYKLGKNPEELRRISKLHPVEQAREMIKLSAAMGGINVSPQKEPVKQLGEIRSGASSSKSGINGSMSVSEIRNRMKAGKFK